MSKMFSATRRLVSIYKSPKKDEMYLYIDKKQPLKDLPEVLLSHFGSPEHVFDLLLTPEKKLARADSALILTKIEEQGFYLQMPPVSDDYMLDVVKAREIQPVKGRSAAGRTDDRH